MIEHLPTPPQESFTWFHAILSGVGILFLWLCGRLGHDINKIGPMEISIAKLDLNVAQITKDVHSIKNREEGVLNSALENMKDMIKRHEEDRANFLIFLRSNPKQNYYE